MTKMASTAARVNSTGAACAGQEPSAEQRCLPHAMPGGVDCGPEEEGEETQPPSTSLLSKERTARINQRLKVRLQAEEKEEARRKWREARRQADARTGVTFAGLVKMLLHANITALSRQQMAHIFISARSTASLQRADAAATRDLCTGPDAKTEGTTFSRASFARQPSVPSRAGMGCRPGDETLLTNKKQVEKQVEELLADFFLFEHQRATGPPLSERPEGGNASRKREARGVGGAPEPPALEADEFRVALFLVAKACGITSECQPCIPWSKLLPCSPRNQSLHHQWLHATIGVASVMDARAA